ncbi:MULTISPECIES: ribonuclease J [unclassified Fusibacter]|uniref:ribonuclease J n=1 Tax=unclassified Fusibacter TaxID=2624464 RepID=UPI00101257F5|nr:MULTISPECIES: ribonuclease J [unclassified Fusibacter]MCK8058913.1 ribonuclease J [Fusibacter sp. A2]NPE21988.1 ribonuclease J [Fusibacter sp. A1]RXV61555.1 ribonuclease J [Fusibacter sp. A1]
MKRTLKVIPLGGLNEIGKNMTAYQYGNEIIVVDCGLKFPEEDMLGIDVVIPNLNYLIENKEKIKGVFITHGHEDHIGAIPYLLREMNVPIYATKLTLALIERKLSEHKSIKMPTLITVKPDNKVGLGSFTIDFIRVSHSIPDAVSLCIESPIGRVIHTGDFKIDFTPIDNDPINLQKFADLGAKGVLALFADSTNADRKGYTMSESSVGDTFETLFRHADQARIIVASFASNVHRIQQIVNAAHANNRKVAFSGRSMLNTSQVAADNGYLNIPTGMLIDVEDIHGYPDNEICVVTTGSQGEPMSALTRMANKDHFAMQIRNGDMVILSSTPIPGNEKSVNKVINKLFEQGANVIYNSLADVHVSGHACQEELKLIHSLVRPKFFVPVHGEYAHLMQHSLLAQRMGMSRDDIFIIANGDVLEFTKESAAVVGKVEAGPTLIDGLGVGDVGNIVLRDRRILSEEGLIMVIMSMDTNGKIVAGPDLISRGFVYVRESEVFLKGAKTKLENVVTRLQDRGVKEWSTIKSKVKNELSEHIYQEMRRRPMILPVIMEVPADKSVSNK